MSNPWFRMYAEFAHDPKVQMLPEVMQRRYVMLMCMRCSNALVTLQTDEIAFHLRIDAAQLEETKALFLAKGFINESWELLNWEKRQFSSDASAQRVAKHRAAKKAAEEAARNGHVTLPQRKSNALDTDTDTDTDTEENKEHTTVPVVAAAPKYSAKADLVASGVTDQTAADWLALRRTKKAPVSKTALDAIRHEAEKAGMTLDSTLALCCTRGWQGFKAEWVLPQASNSQRASPPQASRHSNFENINYHEGIQNGRIT
jgi:hypothetical protein